VQLLTLAARHAVPAMYYPARVYRSRRFDELRSDATDQFRQTGIYAGRILKGKKPAEMPVQLPTKYEFVIKPANGQDP
jgi:putative ABC transport system substrate-binding protein